MRYEKSAGRSISLIQRKVLNGLDSGPLKDHLHLHSSKCPTGTPKVRSAWPIPKRILFSHNKYVFCHELYFDARESPWGCLEREHRAIKNWTPDNDPNSGFFKFGVFFALRRVLEVVTVF